MSPDIQADQVAIVKKFESGVIRDPIITTPNTSIKDISGEQHVYRDFSVNTDNWCIIHKKYELVERRIPPKKLKKRTLPRKNQKNTKLI